MKARARDLAVLAICAIAIVVVAIANGTGGIVSVPSTYDGGPRGYEALYRVLAREGLPVTRLRVPLGLMPATVRVLALTEGAGETSLPYDTHDLVRIEALVARGGSIALFVPKALKLPKALAKLPKARVVRFDVTRYDNGALEAHPAALAGVYAALAGRGPIGFDERIYGYDDTRSFWSVLPPPVHAAAWIALAMLLLVLVDANVPFVAPAPIEPPNDRDSSAYIASMAALLRRGRAARAAIARFAQTYPNDETLERLSEFANPSDAVLLRAAQITASRRKDHA